MTWTYQTAVVTGGASGIGLALVEALAACGVKVLIADIEFEKAERAAVHLREKNFTAFATAVDVSDAESVAALAETARRLLGPVQLLVNNAGVGVGGPLEKVSPKNWEWLFAVNISSIYHAARAFVPAMLESGLPCHIVNTASEHAIGLPPRGGIATPYTATKHAVLGLSDAMRRDYADRNIAVSVIIPALVDTDIWNSFRTRPARFGGARTISAAHGAEQKRGISPTTAAARIMGGIEAGEFYLLTHGRDISEVHEARATELSAAIVRFFERHGNDA